MPTVKSKQKTTSKVRKPKITFPYLEFKERIPREIRLENPRPCFICMSMGILSRRSKYSTTLRFGHSKKTRREFPLCPGHASIPNEPLVKRILEATEQFDERGRLIIS